MALEMSRSGQLRRAQSHLGLGSTLVHPALAATTAQSGGDLGARQHLAQLGGWGDSQNS
jgi:hypothetical protein